MLERQTAPPSRPPPSLDWAKAVGAVSQASGRYGTALSHARLVELQPPRACLAFAPQAGFHKNSVFGSGRATIEKVLSAFFSSPIHLVEEEWGQASQQATPSLAEQQAKRRESHARAMEAKVHANPRIQSALAILGGHIDAIRTLAPAPAPFCAFEDAEEDKD